MLFAASTLGKGIMGMPSILSDLAPKVPRTSAPLVTARLARACHGRHEVRGSLNKVLATTSQQERSFWSASSTSPLCINNNENSKSIKSPTIGQFTWLGQSVAATVPPSFPRQKRHMASLPHRRMLSSIKSQRERGPTLETALAMPLTVREMENESLITLAALDDHDACIEMLIRHIMSTDGCTYEQAEKIFQTIKKFNDRGAIWRTLPYSLGLATALVAGFSSIPLCFHLPTVSWFNEFFVTADVPEPKDLETWLEVGSWAWNWMEPPLGQISFFLLCLQYARAQMQNIGIRPYTSKIKHLRAQRLVQQFPHYDEKILVAYSKTSGLFGNST